MLTNTNHGCFVTVYKAGQLKAKAFLRWEPSRFLMDILRPLLCDILVKLPLRCGLRFSIRVREGVEVAAINGLVLGWSAWVGVGRSVGRQAAIKQERRLAAFPLKPRVFSSQRTRQKHHRGSPMCFRWCFISSNTNI